MGSPPSAWVALLLLASLLGLVAWGSLSPRLQLFGDVLISVPEAHGKVALTFDDGPDPRITPRVLDLLRDREAGATFFVIGERAAKHPELIERMVREGHTVGLHSRDHHRAYALLPPKKVVEDIAFCQQVVKDAGAPDAVWFRPPVGQTSPRTFAGVKKAGVEVVGWSAKARDGLRKTTAGQALERVRAGLVDGGIILLHDAWERPQPDDEEPPAGVRIFGEILDLCEREGLRPVALDELVLAIPSSSGKSF